MALSLKYNYFVLPRDSFVGMPHRVRPCQTNEEAYRNNRPWLEIPKLWQTSKILNGPILLLSFHSIPKLHWGEMETRHASQANVRKFEFLEVLDFEGETRDTLPVCWWSSKATQFDRASTCPISIRFKMPLQNDSRFTCDVVCRSFYILLSFS